MSTLDETIHWIRAADELPDADITVMVVGPDYPDAFVAARGIDDEGEDAWIDAEGFVCDFEVTHWTDMPSGPLEVEEARMRCDK